MRGRLDSFNRFAVGVLLISDRTSMQLKELAVIRLHYNWRPFNLRHQHWRIWKRHDGKHRWTVRPLKLSFMMSIRDRFVHQNATLYCEETRWIKRTEVSGGAGETASFVVGGRQSIYSIKISFPFLLFSRSLPYSLLKLADWECVSLAEKQGPTDDYSHTWYGLYPAEWLRNAVCSRATR